jgi:sensor c-di-GMP phosphodiesterase-like protein
MARGDFSLGQTEIRRDQLLSLISPHSTGMIVYARGISIVLNRAPITSADEQPMLASGLLYDRSSGHVLQIFGHDPNLSQSEIVAQRPVLRDGIYHVPVCSHTYAVCAIAAEPRSAMLGRNRFDLEVVLIDGALFGSTVTAVLLLFFNRRKSLEGRLRRAIRQRRITCVYQPLVHLESNACLGAEALARWVTDSGESIPPEVFIRVAEEKGFVGDISRLVIDRVMEDLAPLMCGEDFRVAINIASQDLIDPQFFTHLEQAVARAGVSPRALAFELTEHTTADQVLAKAAIGMLRNAGYAVYIDDFGTGYSSLAYLHDLQVDAIKVDRAFTRTVGTDAVTASVVPQILDIAARLGLTVIVEGIEEQHQADFFRNAQPGILGQGWLLGRPVTAEIFKSLYASRLATSSHAKLEKTQAS